MKNNRGKLYGNYTPKYGNISNGLERILSNSLFVQILHIGRELGMHGNGFILLQNCMDCKVIPDECVVTQHKLLVVDFYF
jgi:hypothetical protein